MLRFYICGLGCDQKPMEGNHRDVLGACLLN
jgi:hypothetical protein